MAEITILLDPLQKQVAILESWMVYFDKHRAKEPKQPKSVRRKTSDKTSVMFHEAIKSRKSHLELVQRLLQQGKDTQALVSRIQGYSTATETQMRFNLDPTALSAQQYRDCVPPIRTCQEDGTRDRVAVKACETCATAKQINIDIHNHNCDLFAPFILHLILWYVSRFLHMAPHPNPYVSDASDQR